VSRSTPQFEANPRALAQHEAGGGTPGGGMEPRLGFDTAARFVSGGRTPGFGMRPRWGRGVVDCKGSKQVSAYGERPSCEAAEAANLQRSNNVHPYNSRMDPGMERTVGLSPPVAVTSCARSAPAARRRGARTTMRYTKVVALQGLAFVKGVARQEGVGLAVRDSYLDAAFPGIGVEEEFDRGCWRMERQCLESAFRSVRLELRWNFWPSRLTASSRSKRRGSSRY
jgi:hypothetical protein